MAGGGFLLLCFPPTSAAGTTIVLSVKALGGALMSGGMAGDFLIFVLIPPHSMAMGNLNKSMETTPTTTTALKVASLEDHYPQKSKSPFQISFHKIFKNCFL